MSAELGGALGIALLGSVVTVIYRGTVAGALAGTLPPDSLAAARDTLGGALAVAAALPDPLGTSLVTVSRAAFLEAFQTTALLSAVYCDGRSSYDRAATGANSTHFDRLSVAPFHAHGIASLEAEDIVASASHLLLQ